MFFRRRNFESPQEIELEDLEENLATINLNFRRRNHVYDQPYCPDLMSVGN